jgi:hypothetical protein
MSYSDYDEPTIRHQVRRLNVTPPRFHTPSNTKKLHKKWHNQDSRSKLEAKIIQLFPDLPYNEYDEGCWLHHHNIGYDSDIDDGDWGYELNNAFESAESEWPTQIFEIPPIQLPLPPLPPPPSPIPKSPIPQPKPKPFWNECMCGFCVDCKLRRRANELLN